MQAFIEHGGPPPIYQCDIAVNWTYDRWLQEGEPHMVLGLISLIYGSVCIILYIPCCIVLLNPEIRNITEYKMLFLISANQMIQLFINAFMAGVFFILGVVYCNYPLINYHLGCITYLSWTCICCTCFILSTSRLIDMWSPDLHNQLFGGKRAIFSFIFIAIYSIVFYLYSKPVVFNSKELAWVLDPHTYYCFITIANNEGTVTGTLVLTGAFVVSWAYKSVKSDFKMSSSQKQIFILCTFSSFSNLLAATLYVTFQFVSGGVWFNYFGLVSWQLSTAGELVLLTVINRTTRKLILQLFGFRKKSVAQSTTTTTVQVVKRN